MRGFSCCGFVNKHLVAVLIVTIVCVLLKSVFANVLHFSPNTYIASIVLQCIILILFILIAMNGNTYVISYIVTYNWIPLLWKMVDITSFWTWIYVLEYNNNIDDFDSDIIDTIGYKLPIFNCICVIISWMVAIFIVNTLPSFHFVGLSNKRTTQFRRFIVPCPFVLYVIGMTAILTGL